MELAAILRIVAVLACPIGMGLLMWWMMKGMSGEQKHAPTGDQAPADRVAALRAQRETLETEIAGAARLAELEARRTALALPIEKKSKASTQDDAQAPAS